MLKALCELCASVLVCLQRERKTYGLQFTARKLSGKVCPKLLGGITERSCLISESHSIIGLERNSKGQTVHPLPKAQPTLSMLFLSNLFLKMSSAKVSSIPQTAHSHAPWPAYKMSRNIFFSWFIFCWLLVKYFVLLSWKWLCRLSEKDFCLDHKADP